MATQIIDNFQLNVAKPIDSRMVTSGTASRNSIQYLYEGLRVYDLINKAPYVYIDGAWQQESSPGVSSGGSSTGGSGGGTSIPIGTANRLLRYTSTSTIGDSVIFDKGTFNTPNVGIGMIPSISPLVALDVNGITRAPVLKGAINGSYVDLSSISFDKIAPGSNDTILKTIGGQVVWTTATELNKDIVINNEYIDTNINYLLFSKSYNETTTGAPIYANRYDTTKLIGIKPSTSQILASGDFLNNNAGAPGYAFSNNSTAGLYGNSTEVGLSFAGKALLKLNSTKLSIYDTTSPTQVEVMYTDSSKVIFPVATEFNSTLNVTGLATVGSLSVLGISTFKGLITDTLTTTGTATLKDLTISGTSTFNGQLNSTTLNVSGESNLTDLTVTGTTNFTGPVSLNSTLTVTGLATLKDLTVTGTTIFSKPITGTLTVTNLIVNSSMSVGTPYGINNGVATFKTLKVGDNTATSNSDAGLLTCNKLRINPTTSNVPYYQDTTGYSIGDIIFVKNNLISSDGSTNGDFWFNTGKYGGWKMMG
jgi:hypothetical protein